MDNKVHFTAIGATRNDEKTRQLMHDYIEKLARAQIAEKYGDADIWIQHNKREYERTIGELKRASFLAVPKSIGDVISSHQKSVMLLNSLKSKHDLSANLPGIFDTYRRMSSDFFAFLNEILSEGTQKFSTSTSLIKRVKKIDETLLYQHTKNGIKMTPLELAAAHRNIATKGRFVVFDTETLGGRDAFGIQRTHALTEFHFGIYDTSGNKLKTFSTAIGINPLENHFYEQIINDIEKSGYVTEQHKVIAERLAKMGSQQTTYKEVHPGIIKIESTASKVDATNVELMRAGLKKYNEIFELQEKNKVDFNGRKIYAWEKELYDALQFIKNEDLTVVGYNSAHFDKNVLLQVLSRKNGFSKHGAKLFSSPRELLDWKDRHFDVFTALRLSDISNNLVEFYTPDEAKNILKKHNLTPLQLEAIVRKFFPEKYAGASAHVAETDASALASLMLKTDLFNPESPDYVLKAAKNPKITSMLTGKQKMLFYAKESIGPGKVPGISFVTDAMNKANRTFSGYDISNNFVLKGINQYGIQRGVSYTIDDMVELETTSEFINNMAHIHPEVAVDKLIAVRLMPQLPDDSKSYKAKSPVTLVGTREQIEAAINSNMILTAVKNEKGKWVIPKEIEDEVKSVMQEHIIDKNGNIKAVDFTIESQLRESEFRIENEAAARKVREMSYRRSKGLLDLLKDIEETTKQRLSEAKIKNSQYFDAKRKVREEFINELCIKTEQLASEIASGKLTNAPESIEGTFYKYFGWRNPEEKTYTLYREVVDSAISSLPYFESMADIEKVILAKAEELAEGNPITANYYYRMLKSAVYENAAKMHSKSVDELTNIEQMNVRSFDLNKFEIDITKYIGQEEYNSINSIYQKNENILKINLESPNVNLANILRKKRGLQATEDEIEKLRELKRFASFLANNGIIDEKYGTVDLESETYETLTSKIVNGLREMHKKNPQSGYLTIPTRMNVLKESDLAKLGIANVSEIVESVSKEVPRVRIVDKKNLESEAIEITKKVLFDNVNVDTLKKYGFKDEQIRDLMLMRDVRLKDTLELVNKILSATYEVGGSIFYDTDKRKVFLFHGDQYTELNLPYDRFENGRFYTQIGNMKVVNPVGLYKNDRIENGTLRLASSIWKAQESTYKLLPALKRAQKTGTVLEQINRWLSKLNKPIRENPSVMKGDLQDIRSMFHFSVYDVVDNLNNLYELGYFDGVSFEYDAEFRNILKNKRLKANKLSSKENAIILANMPHIIEAIAKRTGESNVRYFLEKLTFDNKDITGFIGTIYNIPYYGDQWESFKRGIQHQTTRAVPFYSEEAAKQIARNVALKGVTLGAPAYTEQQLGLMRHALADTSSPLETTIGVKRLTISTRDLRKVVNDSIQRGKLHPYVAEMLTYTFLEEGGAIADPALLNIFSQRSSMQKIKLRKTMDYNLDTIESLKKKAAVAPIVTVDKHGNVSFKYATGVFVKENDDIVRITGYNAPVQERAKEASMFRLGVFTKDGGLLVTEEDVTKILNQHAQRIIAAQDRRLEALRILNEIFDLEYYIESADIAPYRKMAEGLREKHMATFLVGGIGKIDQRVANVMKELGLENVIGMTLRQEYIDDLTSGKIRKTAFGRLIKRYAGKNIKQENYEKIVGKYFESLEEFKQAVEKERETPYRALIGSLQEAGILQKDETVQYISDSIAAWQKHGDASVIATHIIEGLKEKYGGDTEKVAQILQKAIPGIRVDKETQKLVIPDNAPLHLGELQKIIENEKIADIRKSDLAIGQVSRTTLTQLDFHDRGAVSGVNESDLLADKYGVKMSIRELQMLNWQRWDAETLKAIRKRMSDDEEFMRIYGHAIKALNEDGSVVVKEKYVGKPMAETATKQVLSRMFAPYGEDLILKNGNIIESVIDEATLRTLMPVVQAFKESGIKNLSLERAKTHYEASSTNIAWKWNKGEIEDIEKLKKAGFVEKKLTDLTSLTNENMLIDLHIDELGDRRLYASERERYLALPITFAKHKDDEVLNEIHSSIEALRARASAYIQDFNSGELPQEKRVGRIDNMRNDLMQVKNLITKHLTAKNGLLAELSRARMDSSIRAVAGAYFLYGDEASEIVKKLMFDGINIVEAAAKGKSYDMTIISSQTISQLYDQQLLDKLGVNKEEFVEHLKTQGTLGLNMREPATYRKSVRPVALYFSDVVSKDKMLVSWPTWEGKGGDTDSDLAYAMLTKAKASIKIPGQEKAINAEIDHGLYTYLASKGIEVNLENPNAFNGLISAVHLSAIENAALAEKTRKETTATVLSETAPITEQGATNINAIKERALGDVIYPRRTSMLTTQEISQVRSFVDEILSEIQKTTPEFNEPITSSTFKEFVLQHINEKYKDDAEARVNKIGLLQKAIEHHGMTLERIIKGRKASAGEANNIVFLMRRIVDDVTASNRNISQFTRDAIAQVTLAIEEGFLSPKNEKTVGIEMLDELSKAFNAMVGLNAAKSTEPMRNWIQQYIADRKELKALSDYATGEPISPDSVVDEFLNFFSKVRISDKYGNLYGAGIWQSGLKHNEYLVSPEVSGDILQYNAKLLDTIANLQGIENTVAKENVVAYNNLADEFKTEQASWALNQSEYEAKRKMNGEALDKINKVIKSSTLSSKKLAVSAAGLAAGLMFLGYVGGNPAEPADTQAMQQQKQQEEQSVKTLGIPSLADTNAQIMPSARNKGYIVNIKVQTDADRKYVANAIQQVMASGFRTNVNISMNINEQNGNITDRNIIDTIKEALI